MITLKVFGKDQPDHPYEMLLDRTQRIAARFPAQVTVHEYELGSEEALQLGVARAPALAIDDKLIFVATVPTVGQIGSMVTAALAQAQ